MKVLRIKNIQNCRQLVIMCDVILDCEITKPIIDYLSLLGTCEYFSTFPKPFFKINLSSNHLLKGAEGNKSLRIVLLDSASIECLNGIIFNLVMHIENYPD